MLTEKRFSKIRRRRRTFKTSLKYWRIWAWSKIKKIIKRIKTYWYIGNDASKHRKSQKKYSDNDKNWQSYRPFNKPKRNLNDGNKWKK